MIGGTEISQKEAGTIATRVAARRIASIARSLSSPLTTSSPVQSSISHSNSYSNYYSTSTVVTSPLRVNLLSANSFSTTTPNTRMKYVTQQEAIKLDEELFKDAGFEISSGLQLMELAGLSCSQIIYKLYPNPARFLVIVGPGSDGLVISRHLQLFGLTPIIYYPKRVEKLNHLVEQCKYAKIQFIDQFPSQSELDSFAFIVDAIFGYSFKGDIRAPFDSIIKTLKEVKAPIVSIDIPSGWDVEKGNDKGFGFDPAVLISLGSPKLCAKHYKGIHYLGGRFIPKALEDKYELALPKYPGSDQFVELK